LHNGVSRETRAVTNQTAAGSVGPAAVSRQGACVVLGASSALDPRFAGSGLFAHCTGAARAFSWLSNRAAGAPRCSAWVCSAR